jgi:hypothetical protein
MMQRPVVPACTNDDGGAGKNEICIPSEGRNDGGGGASEDRTCTPSDDRSEDDCSDGEDGSTGAGEGGVTAGAPSDDCSDDDDVDGDDDSDIDGDDDSDIDGDDGGDGDWECWSDRRGDYGMPPFAAAQPRDVNNEGQRRGPLCGTVVSAFRPILFAFQRVVGPIYVAAGFKTQSQPPARYLQRVTVTMRSTLFSRGPSGPFNLTLWDDDGSPNGAPRAPLRSIASSIPGPSSTAGENITVVLAPHQVVLAPSTRYWLVASLADPADLREVNWYTSAKSDSVIGGRGALLHLAVSGDAGATWVAHSTLYTANFAVASCAA